MKAIQVENLSKSYLVGHNNARAESYTALRDVLARNARNLARKTRDMLTGRQIIQGDEVEEFWALKDVSFEIQQGDRVGIIGRNGAGKSTLLKILSRITEPTKGRVTINGRVASLLEVGTGFHPELTGRENIFLNGAILGMGRKEIQRKFDEIVEFAEVEKFLDTPVKRYSSGMYVRLAFAVAAHLEPEILIIDEVLAVGDAQFQRKCLGKMEDVGNQGRTVLFVSHNMGVISQLCNACVWLESGKIRDIGKTSDIVSSYILGGTSELRGEKLLAIEHDKPVQLVKVSLCDQSESVTQNFSCDQSVVIRLEILVKVSIPGLYGYVGIDKPDGTRVLVSDSFDEVTGNPLENLPVGLNVFMVTIPPRTLGHGDYTVHFSMACPSADKFHVDVPGIVCGFSMDDFTSKRGNQRAGYFSTLLPWRNVGRIL